MACNVLTEEISAGIKEREEKERKGKGRGGKEKEKKGEQKKIGLSTKPEGETVLGGPEKTKSEKRDKKDQVDVTGQLESRGYWKPSKENASRPGNHSIGHFETQHSFENFKVVQVFQTHTDCRISQEDH